MNHLTDEQLAGWLAGEADEQTRSQLESCPQCAAEASRIRDGIARYAIAMRQQSSRAHLNGKSAPRRALALLRLRWAGAGVLALLLIAQTAWLLKPHHAPATSQPTAAHHVNPPQDAHPQPAAEMSDDELLEAVNNDLSREVPLALAPVGTITAARNRIAAASSFSATTGNHAAKPIRRETNVP